MQRCTKCQYEVPAWRDSDSLCPRCGVPWQANEVANGWTAVARLTSLAEVGYVADQLRGQNVETEIHQHNEFSAVDGSWQCSYILRVNDRQARTAIELIRQEMDSRRATAEADWASSDREPSTARMRPVWMPLMIVLLAAGVAYLAGRSGPEGMAPADAPGGPLWQALSESNLMLHSDSPPGAPRRSLQFNPHNRTLLLEDDLDGDGRVDRRRAFRAS